MTDHMRAPDSGLRLSPVAPAASVPSVIPTAFCYRVTVEGRDGNRWRPIITAPDAAGAVAKAEHLYGSAGRPELLHATAVHDGRHSQRRGGNRALLEQLAEVALIDRRRAAA